MAFDDTNCPCGDQKMRETLLCEKCEAYLADRPETKVMRDLSSSWESKRGAAIRLLAMARSRKHTERVMRQAAASNAFRMEHGYA